jgi:hydrogenase maturation factor
MPTTFSSTRTIPLGKIPGELLARLLDCIPAQDRRAVVVGPAPGEDGAVVRLDRNLVAVASDPITFPTAAPGAHSVHVNANDIAVMGAVPRFMTLTLLLPPDTTEHTAAALLRQAVDAAGTLGVLVVGGHTEVTDAVTRPVLAGTMLGELRGPEPVRTGGGRPGDTLIQVNPMAVEGTAILAVEYRDRLLPALGPEELARAAGFLRDPGISVVAAALAVTDAGGVHAMHDPTEGGLATGLLEMADAAGCGLDLDGAALICDPLTRRICRELDCSPLGLISSGCLLAAVGHTHTERVLAALRERGFRAAAVGRLTAEPGVHRLRTAAGASEPLPRFAVDELAALPARLAHAR